MLTRRLEEVHWNSLFENLNSSDAAALFTEVVLEHVSHCIPSRVHKVVTRSHPWLNERCVNAIKEKRDAIGTQAFSQMRDRCSAILLEEYNKFIRKVRVKLTDPSCSPKKWWELTKQLQLQGKSSASSVPPLQRFDGSWALDALEKAKLLAETFEKKSELPPEEFNDFSDLPPAWCAMPDFFVIRSRHVFNVLQKLNVHSSTGPDGLSSQVLKRCAGALVFPIRVLAQLILRDGIWPTCWRFHWIYPLYKKKGKIILEIIAAFI